VTISLVVAPWAAAIRVSASRMVSGHAVLPRVLNLRSRIPLSVVRPNLQAKEMPGARRERQRSAL